MSQPRIALESRRVDELLADPHNARRHPPRNLEQLRASLTEFGQQKNIVVLPNGQIVAGHGFVMAARDLGWERVDVKVFDGDLDAARRYGIRDNRTGELADWDPDELVAQLSEVGDWAELGWTAEEWAALTGTPGGALNEPGEGFNRFDHKDEYDAGTRRLMMIDLPVAQFVWLQDMLARIRDDNKRLASNADVVLWLVAKHTGEVPPEPQP